MARNSVLHVRRAVSCSPDDQFWVRAQATVPTRLSAPVVWLIRYSQMVELWVVGSGDEPACGPLSLTVQLGQLAT